MTKGAKLHARVLGVATDWGATWGLVSAIPLMMAPFSVQAQTAGPFNYQLIPAAPITMLDVPQDQAGEQNEWTLRCWAKIAQPGDLQSPARLVALTGPDEGVPLAAVTFAGNTPGLKGISRTARSTALRNPRDWHYFALVSTGKTLRLYVDGKATTAIPLEGNTPPTHIQLGPDGGLGGLVAGLRLDPGAATPVMVRNEAQTPPDAALIQFTQASAHWPLQVRQMQGQVTPQPAATLPKSATAPDAPVAKPLEPRDPVFETTPRHWTLQKWSLAQAPDVADGGATLSRPSYIEAGNGKSAKGPWYAATVPGTVLTTLVDRGVYPDPSHGLNNLAIPEKLAHQDYWYRTVFDLPADADGKRLELLLNGVNYSSAIWVNGQEVGTTKGAFVRGQFDVSALLKPGRNAIAIRVSPPPHPGLAHEESLTAGVGENGGTMMLDGPTFGAAEGWDWIPTIRDRQTGLWQDVRLIARGDVRMGDPQVVTTLPRADNSIADVEITVPVTNDSDQSLVTTVRAAFDDVAVERQVTVPAHQSMTVRFSPKTDPALSVHNPRLWWPNGYGDPALHTLHLSAQVDGAASDTRQLRFGMRQVTYELSLVDQSGALDRVLVDFEKARSLGQQIVDERHQAIRQVKGGWAYSFAKGAQTSPAVTPIKGDEGLSPYLVIRVNGVRIAARGGSVGMDDFMKRVDRAHLEPYFRLHQDAHVNIIRNWVGQDTEESFFDLADQYGLMVLSDFWESTQDYNIEAEDADLFLANAKDVVKRFRNHPSIIAWFGRNEGVPQPVINEGLADMLRKEDGTRFYMPGSNRINLHDSGPYNWREPEKYFTEYSKGFAVEVGTPSFPTLESWKRTVPASELWPISDTWAYHDWHQTGNGAVKSFTDAMDREFGKPTSLPDFARKAQMLEYESYRAIFEGMNAGLWTTNSGRMLWMTQPAWPSSAWQIFSSDYDTHGAFYGMKKASEPIHVQMNLPDHKVILVNNEKTALAGMTVRACVQSLSGKDLASREIKLDVAAGQIAEAYTLDLAPLMTSGPVLVHLEALDSQGAKVSDNVYWQASSDAALQAMSTMAPVALTASARRGQDQGDDHSIVVTLRNSQKIAAIQAKLTLFDDKGEQMLPAYFSDNYVSLLPGEARTITITAPRDLTGSTVTLRGWNVAEQTLSVEN